MKNRYFFKAKIKGNNTGYKELDWIIGNLVVEQNTIMFENDVVEENRIVKGGGV